MSEEFIDVGYGEALQFGVSQGVYYKDQKQVVESLHHQLATVQAELEAERNRRFEGNRISSQEYNDSQKREVMLRDALEITHELYANATSGYGFARPDNPHNFHCDIECCSKEEIAAHSKACDDYAAGRKVSDDSWGIGTYCDEYEPALKALAATADLEGLIVCHAEPCRDDGRCQYAIDHGAEGLGHCPEGKCCMPLYRAWEPHEKS
jgi:hypothetical protein